MARCLECDVDKIQYVHLGNNAVGVDAESFREEEIEDGAKLGVCNVRTSATFQDVVEDTLELNGETLLITAERFRKLAYDLVEIDPRDPSHILGDLDWDGLGLTTLPDSIGDLRIDGDLILTMNEFSCLPDTFANLVILGNLDLSNCDLVSLPENIGVMQIGGNLRLRETLLSSLPASFSDITVEGGTVDLSYCRFDDKSDPRLGTQYPLFDIVWRDADDYTSSTETDDTL